MPNAPLRLAVIIGSNREGRFGGTVAEWFAGVARRNAGVAVEMIDLAEHHLPTVISMEPAPEVRRVLDEVSGRLERADAFAVVTPEYNHSYPASLKNLLDWTGTQWHAKPVGFVSYGGVAGGSRAVEHLRTVCAELHATTVRDVVTLSNVWEQFGEDGQVTNDTAPAAAKTLLDQLIWWGNALRDARAKTPYSG
ncbi:MULTISPECIES: NADPH-dependent FMN reductase [unclassified Streptomyces]|uniref:NADPH-dependent FMN reductase n=1 Tax=unclassified Streptomyces TaxID=2593676 RepID=UPI002237AF4C|nr:NAD(P)H-dependent oxidoreductase [Streptomyces sp. SHP 1-2]MCW5249969.1 NAD(P)H-dependent oxidoreductase [Streptomyces sp. SHP 1-2]